MLKKDLVKLLEGVPDDTPISVVSGYEDIDCGEYDILEVITLKSTGYDIRKNDFGDTETNRRIKSSVYLLIENG